MTSNDLATTAMWDNAVESQESVDRLKAVTSATVALAGAWPYLAAAQSREGFEERLALMQESIERTTPPEVLDEVVSRLRTNFVEMHAQRLASQAASHTAARRITAAKQGEELPQAFVHVHKHGSGDDEYHQVDHVASPTWMNTIAHVGDRDEAMTKAREFSVANSLPLYENGRYVEGSVRLASVQPGQEFWDAQQQRWVRVAEPASSRRTAAQIFRPGGGQAVGLSREAHERLRGNWGEHLASGDDKREMDYGPVTEGDRVLIDAPGHRAGSAAARAHGSHGVVHKADAKNVTVHTDDGGEFKVPRALVKKNNSGLKGGPAKTAGKFNDGHVTQYVGWARSEGHDPDHPATLKAYEKRPGIGRAHANHIADQLYIGGGDSDWRKSAAYSGDPDAAWRYHYPDVHPQTPVGGSPVSPVPGPGDAQPVSQTSVGPDGFPIDVAGGEYDGAAAKMQQILTPSPWTVTPGSEWPVRPNAGSFDQTPRVAASNASTHKWTKSGYCGQCGMDKPDRGEWVPKCDTVQETLGDKKSSRRQASDGNKSTDDFHTYNSQGGPYGNTGEGGNDLVDEMIAKGSDHKRQGMDQRQHSQVWHEIMQNHGGDAADAYKYGYDVAKMASRRQATEGVVPTPGPNPNYFSQGTQGLSSAPGSGFPENPSADIEPKLAPNLDTGLYGTTPPVMSQGTASDGTVDGQGYSRTGAKTKYQPGYPHMIIHPAETFRNGDDGDFQLHEVKLHESPEESFTVGHWPASTVEDKAKEFGTQYMGWNGHRATPPVHKLGSRPFARSAEERTASRRVSNSSLYDARYDEHAEDPEDEPCHDEWCRHNEPFHTEGEHMDPSHRDPGHPDYQSAERGVEDALGGHYDWLLDRNHIGPSKYSARTAAFGRTAYDEHDQASEADDARIDDLMERRHESGQHDDEADEDCWKCQSAHHTAATNGQIVGMCDHCTKPVRYHSEGGGHLRHLHNDSAKCSDGKVSTAVRVDMGGYEARFRLSPFVERSAAVLENPTAENPTGRGADPYRARTQWEGFENQRPRQRTEDMNANTPTTAGEPIKTRNSNTPLPGAKLDEDGPGERDDQDEEDDDD